MVRRDFDWEPLFDLSPYEISAEDFDGQRILGVEADAADGVVDGQHDYHLIAEGTGAVITAQPAAQFSTPPISYCGSNTGATGMVAIGKSILIGENVSGGCSDIQFALAA